MDRKELDDLWGQVENFTRVERLDEGARYFLGSICGQMSSTIEGLQSKSINNLCQDAYSIAKSKGWHDDEHETATWLALIHSEVSEALEADRKGDVENFTEELADVCIRVFNLCGLKGIDLEKAILDKMEYNKKREYKHGGKLY